MNLQPRENYNFYDDSDSDTFPEEHLELKRQNCNIGPWDFSDDDDEPYVAGYEPYVAGYADVALL